MKASWLVLALLPGVVSALAFAQDDGVELLQKATEAAQTLSYSGVFVYQHGGRMETLKVLHGVVDGQEKTRIDTLDGPPREIIRSNDEMKCYFPDSHRVRVEHHPRRMFFPALLMPPVQEFLGNYSVVLKGSNRVAGHDCQVIELQPRDNYRYTHRFCADEQTHLLLREATMGSFGRPIQVSEFSELAIGVPIAADQFKSSYPQATQWRQHVIPLLANQEKADEWSASDAPPGFHKVVEVHRTSPKGHGPMTHLVYSDGLASVSVFIEPVDGSLHLERIKSLRDSLSYYSIQKEGYQITVIGEVPVDTVTQIGQSVVQRRSSQQ